MLITTPEVKRTVQDYDITFEAGFALPITIDKVAGDTITITDKAIQIHLADKPSRNDPSKTLHAADITIFTSKICSIRRQDREVEELTPEEAFSWAEEFKKLNSTDATKH